MDSFIELVIVMLQKGISVELKFTPSNANSNAIKAIESSPAQPSQPIPSEDLKPLSKVLTEKELNDKDFKELDELLYPESIDG